MCTRFTETGEDCQQQGGSAAVTRCKTISPREQDYRLVLSNSQRAHFISKLINDFAPLHAPAVSLQVLQCDNVLHT